MTTPMDSDPNTIAAIARLTAEVTGMRGDVARLEKKQDESIARIDKKLDESISAGQAHRTELDRRVTRLEAETPRYVTYRQLVMWATGGAVGAGGIVAALHQLITTF